MPYVLHLMVSRAPGVHHSLCSPLFPLIGITRWILFFFLPLLGSPSDSMSPVAVFFEHLGQISPSSTLIISSEPDVYTYKAHPRPQEVRPSPEFQLNRNIKSYHTQSAFGPPAFLFTFLLGRTKITDFLTPRQVLRPPLLMPCLADTYGHPLFY